MDEEFNHPRLAQVYDALDGDRDDLRPYVALAEKFGNGPILDVGCGTGTFALLLARKGFDVVGLDPAEASLQVARGKGGLGKVRWVHGDISRIAESGFAMAFMTANVAQVFLSDTDWQQNLHAICAALRPGGRLVFETRDPSRKAWEDWTKAKTLKTVSLPGEGKLTCWCEVTDVALPLVSFQWTFRFASDGAVLTSRSTLRFRAQDEIVSDLHAAGFDVEAVNDAPDRPGQELVFTAIARGGAPDCDPALPASPAPAR